MQRERDDAGKTKEVLVATEAQTQGTLSQGGQVGEKGKKLYSALALASPSRSVCPDFIRMREILLKLKMREKNAPATIVTFFFCNFTT